MHGFNQGMSTIHDVCNSHKYDAIFVQEHWLFPHNIDSLLSASDHYTGYGVSAMVDKLDSGVFYGRPFGGVAILLQNDHVKLVTKVICRERYAIVCMGDTVLISVYLPCMSNIKKENHVNMLIDIFDQMSQHLNDLDFRHIVLGGDLNTDLRLDSYVSEIVHDFVNSFRLIECSTVCSPRSVDYTYKHPSLGHSSWIDWLLVSYNLRDSIVNFDIVDCPLNLSDHLPVSLEIKLAVVPNNNTSTNNSPEINKRTLDREKLRWDKAALDLYCM